MELTIAQYRIHPGQNSKMKFQMAKKNWYLYRDFEKFSVLKSIYYFSNYAIRGVFKTNKTLIISKLSVK